MPFLYTGATLEPVEIPIQALFSIRKLVQDEIEKRAWAYIARIGWKPFREEAIEVSIKERGAHESLILVHITASFEADFEHQNLDIEVPLQLFESLVPHKPETHP